jgi:hypothetical protein
MTRVPMPQLASAEETKLKDDERSKLPLLRTAIGPALPHPHWSPAAV